ncbi:homocysteine S-methyltransferase [Amycolatopsis marina]|uniref:Homocysteine S-methyltransferase n=1 Tax=Amycolatopsis marina TaxID=490629 RepID=A0A1I1B9L5_9PSEU|nr:homocysteine S-methyltransferase [Amycolatopsis marina]SFB45398.1 homocysteine S-methyltransferase [Amycolatopsis marina]
MPERASGRLGEALAAAGTPLVLDGGLATELEARGHDLSGALWSARLLRDAPEEIVAAHAAFFAAGAEIAITASYQASFPGFAAAGIGHDETVALLRRSVEVARQARDQVPGTGRRRWIAASVGPYGAALADGSEYRGRYGLGVAELADFHRPRLEVLAGSGADVLALETVPDQVEAVALLSALDGLDVPVWLSYTVDGGRTRAGQPLDEAFAVAAEHDGVVAVGVNCCAPGEVTHAASVARAVTGKPVIAYPNSGETWDAAGRRWTGRSDFGVDVRDWAAAGVRIAGGCCRVGPAQISAIAARLG